MTTMALAIHDRAADFPASLLTARLSGSRRGGAPWRQRQMQARLDRHRQRHPLTAPIGFRYAAPWTDGAETLWFADSAALVQALLQDVLPLVALRSWSARPLARKIRALSPRLLAGAMPPAEAVAALTRALDPWLQVLWVGHFEQLRAGEGESCAARVRRFLDWPAELPCPEVPAYALPRFIDWLGQPGD